MISGNSEGRARLLSTITVGGTIICKADTILPGILKLLSHLDFNIVKFLGLV